MLLTKVCVIKAMVFPIVTYGCQSWTIKKAECRRIDAFKLWCWRRLLRVPWTARRSSQSTLKGINPEYSLEGLMVKPKLQSFGHLIQRADSLEKILILGKMEDGWGGQQKMKWLRNIKIQWIGTWASSERRWGTGWPGAPQSVGLQTVRHNLSMNSKQHVACGKARQRHPWARSRYPGTDFRTVGGATRVYCHWNSVLQTALN